MIVPNLGVELDGRPQRYEFGSVSIQQSWVRIWRIDPTYYPRHQQVASRGPHIEVYLGHDLLLGAFKRRCSVYCLAGPDVGSLSMVSGAAARDGTETLAIDACELTMLVEPETDRFALDIKGRLVETEQGCEGWSKPHPYSAVAVSLEVPVTTCGELFEKIREEVPQEAVNRLIERYHR